MLPPPPLLPPTKNYSAKIIRDIIMGHATGAVICSCVCIYVRSGMKSFEVAENFEQTP
jgi:hypothetical protein